MTARRWQPSATTAPARLFPPQARPTYEETCAMPDTELMKRAAGLKDPSRGWCPAECPCGEHLWPWYADEVRRPAREPGSEA